MSKDILFRHGLHGLTRFLRDAFIAEVV